LRKSKVNFGNPLCRGSLKRKDWRAIFRTVEEGIREDNTLQKGEKEKSRTPRKMFFRNGAKKRLPNRDVEKKRRKPLRSSLGKQSKDEYGGCPEQKKGGKDEGPEKNQNRRKI